MRRILRSHGALAIALAMAVGTSALAEDVEKRWRISAALGGYNALDEVESSAANVFTVIDRFRFERTGQQVANAVYLDPRDDNASFGQLDINSGPLGTLALQYAATKTLIFEASVGYQKSDVGDIELSGELQNDPPRDETGRILNPQLVPFNYRTVRFKAGELERIPIQFNALVRFRPRAKFNPYFGGGIGYSIIGFEPSSELNEISLALDNLRGSDCTLASALTGSGTASCTGDQRNLSGATVDASDSFEWNLTAGAEIQLRRKMAVFVDLRWIDSSRTFSIGFDNSDELGRSVPQLIDFSTSPAALEDYGPVGITQGGLIDGGVVQYFSLDASDNCNPAMPEASCSQLLLPSPGSGQTLLDLDAFDDCLAPGAGGTIPGCTAQASYVDTDPGDGDGRVDPGEYYLKGGEVKYDGLSLQFGFRYTF